MDGPYQRYQEIVQRFAQLRIGVLGDLILDIYLYGKPTRISREAPVMIVVHEKQRLVPGGAGNTINNLQALQAKVIPCALVGHDQSGQQLVTLLQEQDIETTHLLPLLSQTTSKTRILAGDRHTTKHQILRYDREASDPVSSAAYQGLRNHLASLVSQMDAWIISDYGYGTATPELCTWLRTQTSRPIIADSRHRIAEFRGASAVTPNEEEALQVAALSQKSDLQGSAAYLLQELQCQAVLITRGNQGMLLCEKAAPPLQIPICGSPDIVDVSGAGDTVAAVMGLAIAAGASYPQASRLANYAASVVVMKPGTAVCTQAELLEVLAREHRQRRL